MIPIGLGGKANDSPGMAIEELKRPSSRFLRDTLHSSRLTTTNVQTSHIRGADLLVIEILVWPLRDTAGTSYLYGGQHG